MAGQSGFTACVSNINPLEQWFPTMVPLAESKRGITFEPNKEKKR